MDKYEVIFTEECCTRYIVSAENKEEAEKAARTLYEADAPDDGYCINWDVDVCEYEED